MNEVSQQAKQLIDKLESLGQIVVAFSGGVDSSVVAAAATKANLRSCLAVTAQSPSVPAWQLSIARQIATEIGIEHTIVTTDEGERDEYIRNDGQRCFFCKQTLYAALKSIARANAGSTIVSGTNADDLGDYRPGIDAGTLADVQTPLADLGFGKAVVRDIASYFGLSNHALPASPCLASRVAYGVSVTPQRLQQIEQAEQWLRSHGFSDCRVRLHADELARVEVPRAELGRLLEGDLGTDMTTQFLSIGFRYVTIDAGGLQSGSLNRALVSIATP